MNMEVWEALEQPVKTRKKKKKKKRNPESKNTWGTRKTDGCEKKMEDGGVFAWLEAQLNHAS